MPFFIIQTHRLMKPQPMPIERVETLCRQRSLEDLQSLKERMRAFFTEQSAIRKKAILDISAIDAQIKAIRIEIVENQTQIELGEARNRDIMNGLPGNGAERYLALQKLYTVPNISSLKENEIKTLQATQAKLRKDIAWINYEFTTCDPEWKIVNKIIDEKTPKVTPTPEKSMRL